MLQQTVSRLSLGFLVAGALLLAGCPKKPEVLQSEARAVGSAAQPAPGASAQPAGSGTPKAAAPAERLPARPEIVAGAGKASGAPAPVPATAGAPESGPRPAASGAVASGAAAPGPAASGAPASRASGPRAKAESPLKDVFFDTDRSIVKPEGKLALNEDTKWLNANPKAAVVIQGHCDERGTEEYNLALGQRRANTVRDYLVAAGIDAKRLSTISYGKDRPFVIGHDEEAWKWDRRAHFAPK